MRIKIYVLAVCSIGVVSAVLGMHRHIGLQALYQKEYVSHSQEALNQDQIVQLVEQYQKVFADKHSSHGPTDLYGFHVYSSDSSLSSTAIYQEDDLALYFFALKTFGIKRPTGNVFGYCDAERNLFQKAYTWTNVGCIKATGEQLKMLWMDHANLTKLVKEKNNASLADILVVHASHEQAIVDSFMHNKVD